MTLAAQTTELLNAAVVAAVGALAEEIIAIDVTSRLPFNDAFLICTADNPRHMRAVQNSIEVDVRKETGRTPLHVEGGEDSEWILINYGDVAVHLFLGEARGYYSLDKLWGAEPRVDITKALAAAA